MSITLTPTQIMFVRVMADVAIRKALEATTKLTEKEMRAEIAKEQARKDRLMEELKGL